MPTVPALSRPWAACGGRGGAAGALGVRAQGGTRLLTRRAGSRQPAVGLGCSLCRGDLGEREPGRGQRGGSRERRAGAAARNHWERRRGKGGGVASPRIGAAALTTPGPAGSPAPGRPTRVWEQLCAPRKLPGLGGVRAVTKNSCRPFPHLSQGIISHWLGGFFFGGGFFLNTRMPTELKSLKVRTPVQRRDMLWRFFSSFCGSALHPCHLLTCSQGGVKLAKGKQRQEGLLSLGRLDRTYLV